MVIRWSLAGVGVLLLLILVATPVSLHATVVVLSPTNTQSPTPAATRTPTRTPTPFPAPQPPPDWMFVGTEGRDLGSSVSSAGDVNGDGFADVIVGQPVYNSGGDKGKVHLFYGSPDGPKSLPSWTTRGNLNDLKRGLSVSAAGDVNGDGYSDVIIGAPGYSNTIDSQGRAYLYYGSPAGLGNSPGWTVSGGTWQAYLGNWVGSAGDVNGDGYDDVIVGAYGYKGDLSWGQGRAYVWCGSAGGLQAAPCWTATGDQGKSFLGYGGSVAAGDVNADGYSDVIVTAPWYTAGQSKEGRAYLYYGSAAGLQATPGWMVEGDQVDASLGNGRAAIGDINGDGWDDVILAAQLFDAGAQDEGRVFVYHGSPAGPGSAADWTADGNQGFAHFGADLAAVGDMNADGYADVIVGAPMYDHGQIDEGAAFIYHGSAAGLNSVADQIIEADLTYTGLGSAAGAAGDVNGDGRPDFILGAPGYNANSDNVGAAFVYLANAPLTTSTPTPTPTETPSATPSASALPMETETPAPTGTPGNWPPTYLPLILS